MKIQRKLLSLLGIASIIGGGSALSVLATSCGKGEPFVPAFSLFEDVSVNTEAQAKKAMKSVTWIWKHCSEYGYSDYKLYSNDAPFNGNSGGTPVENAFMDSILYRFGGNTDYGNTARESLAETLDNGGAVRAPIEVSIWCELVYDMSWQYCNSLYFQISSFEIGGFQDPTLWCNVGGQGIGGTAYIHTVYESGVDGAGIVLDNDGEQMDTKYVDGYFAEMGLSDDTKNNIYNKSFTCSWGSTSNWTVSYTPDSYTIHTGKLFGIGEMGSISNDDGNSTINLYDEPTLYWFNTSFILQNCI